uniref:Major facilitator superfamily (MFS) profile domain-containing protein n=1 Tax=Timema cristinae TaxID=61476 RepID=A0A7R9GR31_TIMCR|nr:unnamed protein product [Timema cristinae]
MDISPEGSSQNKARWWRNVPARYVFVAESCFTLFLLTFMGSISPTAVASMILRVTVVGGNNHGLDVCVVESSSNESYNVTSGEFEWDGATQTMVLTGSSLGTLVSLLVSARLCEVFGVKRLVGYSFLISGLLEFVQPTFMHIHGVVQPGFSILFVRWLEKKERTKLAAFVFTAQIFGTLFAMFTAGQIVDAFGWKGVVPVAPWLKIITCPPFWAHISVNLAVAWISFTIGTELPLYLTKVLNYNIKQTSLLSALPPLAQLTSNVMCAILSHFIKDRGILSTLSCYKVFNTIATLGPAVMMILIPQLGCDHVAIVAVLVVAMFFNGAYYGGSFINHLDLGPNFAGSISAFVGTLAGIIRFSAPLLANMITEVNTLTAWSIVFYISAAVSAFPLLVYLIFGSAEEQPWNKILYDDEMETSNEKYVNSTDELITCNDKLDHFNEKMDESKLPAKEDK